jgi:hypothetical protein
MPSRTGPKWLGPRPQAPFADAEGVAGIDGAFHGACQLEAGLGMHLRQEPLPNLPDAGRV